MVLHPSGEIPVGAGAEKTQGGDPWVALVAVDRELLRRNTRRGGGGEDAGWGPLGRPRSCG